MSRRRQGKKVVWKATVPQDLALRIELRYCDESTRKPDYGARSRLTTALLRIYDEAIITGAQDLSPTYVTDRIHRMLQIGKYAVLSDEEATGVQQS